MPRLPRSQRTLLAPSLRLSRGPALVLLAVLAASLLLPPAQAALNGARDYEAFHGYLPGLDGPQFTMASGRLEANVPDGQGAFGLFATQGAEVIGLTRVCWTATIRQCADSANGALSIRVLPGGSFGLQLPGGADARLEADHALAMFTDLSDSSDLNGLELGRSLVAPLVAGRVEMDLPSIPSLLIADPTSEDGGALAATEETTQVEVLDGGDVRATLRGKVDPVTFAGSPQMDAVVAELAVLPFDGGSAVARFAAADRDDAALGLDIARINGLMRRLYAANEGSAVQAQDIDPGAFGPYADAAAAMFAGAVLSLPTEGNASASAQALAFARTPQLQVRSVPNGGLAWSGKATLDIRDGHVAGAPTLYGWEILSLPWWSWLLWLLAIGVFVTRLVLKPEKHHPRWDRYRWIGWVAGPVVGLLIFVLWDLELRAVLGLSLFSGTASGQVLLFVLLLQVLTFLFFSFAVVAPLRLLLRNGSMLLRQGTFMGLAGAAAWLLGFLVGFRALLAGLELIVSKILSSIV